MRESTSTPRPFSLAIVQLRANPDDVDLLDHAETQVRAAAAAGGEVIVLPELFRSPYFCREMDPVHCGRAEAVPGPTTERLGALAAELGVVIVASLFERAMPGLYYNTTAVLDADGALLGTYRKSHIPDDPLYYEKFYFAPGDSGYRVFDTRFCRLAVLICWDQWYPEAARAVALEGAELVVYPTAIGTIEAEGPEEHARQLDAWVTVQRGHAVANGLFVAAVNRAGREAELDFWGNSFVCGPQGEVLARLGTEEQIAVVGLGRARLREVRDMWPFFRDRRVDTYQGLLRRGPGSPR
jgi:N-carbamoylputrescine amidase